MKYLIQTTETYRTNAEAEAVTLIEEARTDNKYDLLKYNCSKKEVKAKGEVVDEYYVVTLTKGFNDVKDPIDSVQINYER